MGFYRINETMENELISVIRDIVGSYLGDVIWDKQDAFVADDAAVKPEKDFYVLNISDGPNEETKPEYRAEGEATGLFTVTQGVVFTVSINLYTNNAHLFKAAKLIQKIQIEEYKNRLKSVGLGYRDNTNVRDLSELDETRFNLRSHIDLIFSYILIESGVNLGEIEKFEATGTLGTKAVEIKVHK